MRGDFSRRDDVQKKKYSGVLHQQGRVLLDSDWNDQVAIQDYWKEILSRDVIGEHVVAVPASQKDAFKILKAERQGNDVKVQLAAGRAWVDGLLLHNEDGAKERLVPLVPGAANSPREALLLRAWQQEVSAFQDEDLLLEKALGGPDTTERIENAYALYRWPAESKTCEELREEMAEFFLDQGAQKIQLNVQFQKTTETDLDGADCPAVQAGGYRGLEHSLYRIEMVEVTKTLTAEEEKLKPFFKWSHMNGGLVGAGSFKDEGNNLTRFIPTKNIEAFRRSGFSALDHCYLETYSRDPVTGLWAADFGATVNFDGDTLLVDKVYVGAVPSEDPKNPATRFFRLWSGLRSAQDFKTGFVELRDGIELQFSNLANGRFLTGDYWTFEVRANSPDPKPFNFGDTPSAPHGPVYHTACLGVVDWAVPAGKDPVHDCRKVFDPLVDLDQGCCLEVSPEEDLAAAVKQIADAGGGCLCLLPGKHLVRETLDLSSTRGVVFKGLGPVCELVVPEEAALDSVFLLKETTETTFQGFSLILEKTSVKSVWEAPSALKLTIKDTQVVCFNKGKKDPLKDTVILKGRILNGLELISNIWLAWKCLSVAVLSDARVEKNWFLFGDVGIFAVGALALQIHHNRFLVVEAERELNTPLAAGFHSKDPLRVRGLLASVLHTLGRWKGSDGEGGLQMKVLSAALQITAGAQVDLQRNLLSAARGFQAIVLADSCVDHNQIVASLSGMQIQFYGAGLRFRENILMGAQKKLLNVGFYFGGRVQGVELTANSVQSAREGILFEVARPESLMMRALATAREFEVIDENATEANLKDLRRKILEEGQRELTEAAELMQNEFKRQGLDDKTFGVDLGQYAGLLGNLLSLPSENFPLEDLTLQANHLHTTWNGIEISGKRDVTSYLLSDNLVSGCEGVAIYLPGEGLDLQEEIAKRRDARKSVVANKVLCKGLALWSQHNEIRIESNDFRVQASNVNVMSWFKSIFEPTAAWSAIESQLEDPSGEGLQTPVLFKTLTETLEKTAQEKDLSAIVGGKNSAWSVYLDLLKGKDHDEVLQSGKRLVSTKVLLLMIAALRGFAVSVWGISSTVRMNKIDVEALSLPGGLIVGSLSGEISENDISAQSLGVMLSEDPGVIAKVPKEKEAKIIYSPIQIAGNRVSVEAALSQNGESARFSLLIPRILRGDLSITGNHFVGDVHIGANLDFEIDKNALMAMDLEGVKKNVSAAANKVPAQKRPVFGNALFMAKPREKGPDRGARLPHPKILFANNQTLNGAVSILPFSFRMKSVSGKREYAKPQIELVTSEQNQMPMVSFTGNQLDAGRKTSFVFGYQVVISGNQSLIETTPGAEEYSLIGMAWKNEYLYAKGNMPEALEAQHV